jgi:hypothetical protein
MSGRLMPAAATSINSSPMPGCGIGRLTAVSASGPPGVEISIAVMESGRAVMVSLGSE